MKHDIHTPTEAIAPLKFYREDQHPSDAALVRSLSVEDLFVLYDAAQTISEAALSIMNRPNCDDLVFNWLENQSDRSSDVRSYIVEEFSRRPMSGSKTEDERRMGVVISWDLHECGCGAMEAIVKLAQMKRDHDHAALEKGRQAMSKAA